MRMTETLLTQNHQVDFCILVSSFLFFLSSLRLKNVNGYDIMIAKNGENVYGRKHIT